MPNSRIPPPMAARNNQGVMPARGEESGSESIIREDVRKLVGEK